jgi:hypothetical protein
MRRGSRGVLPQVVQAPRHIANHSKQHVHGSRLDIAAGFPSRDGIAPEPEQTGQFGLGETVAFPDGADLVRGE